MRSWRNQLTGGVLLIAVTLTGCAGVDENLTVVNTDSASAPSAETILFDGRNVETIWIENRGSVSQYIIPEEDFQSEEANSVMDELRTWVIYNEVQEDGSID